MGLHFEAVFKNLVEPLGLDLVTFDAIVDFSWSIAIEVVGLALYELVNISGYLEAHEAIYLHGTYTALQPHKPFDYFPVLVRIVGIGDLVVEVVFLT